MRIAIMVWLVLLGTVPAAPPVPVDSKATAETRQLLDALHRGSGHILFGHQDTSAYGVGFSDMKRWIIEADARGGINTLSLHLDNPISGGSAHDNRPAVEHILPDGLAHEVFLQTLDDVATFLQALKRKDGKLIPIVLRPFHEHNQTWPWWGQRSCTESNFIALWRMTVRHLLDTRGVHNVLYAYSPQDVSSEQEYLRGYPGDEFVDVFGLDYYRAWHWRQVPQMGKSLSLLNRLAAKHGKIAALTETGVDKVPNADWWTEYLLKALKHDEWTRRTRWVLVWRNKSRGHHFGPFPGHPSAKDFVNFSRNPLMRFGETRD